ncbi:unnamed protein product [Leuciscus chuanchicus]
MSRVWTGGHSSPVLCAAVSSEAMVATGAEAGELTLWSPAGSPLSSLHLSADVTGLCFSPADPSLLSACHGRTVTLLDLRSLKTPLAELRDVAEDEINGVCVDESGRTLAAGDDTGAVTLVDLQQMKATGTLRTHTNICSSVAFRPRRPQSLVSAGLDMQVCLWTLPKPRPVWSVSLQDTQQEHTGQVFNPPLAHCVCVSSCGDVCVCAAEDGGLHLLRACADGRLRERGMIPAHSQGASQAHFISFLSHPYWLASGGNDGLVALWDLSRHPLVDHSKKKKKKKRKKRGQNPQDEEEVCSSETRPRLCFQHTEKVNWVCPAVLEGKPSLLVTDQTSCPTVYSLEQL